MCQADLCMWQASAANKIYAQQIPVNLKTKASATDFQKTADDILLSKYTPAGVVVNEAMDIVHFRGKHRQLFGTIARQAQP